jgi:uncharacterized protein YpmS
MSKPTFVQCGKTLIQNGSFNLLTTIVIDISSCIFMPKVSLLCVMDSIYKCNNWVINYSRRKFIIGNFNSFTTTMQLVIIFDYIRCSCN